MFKSTEFTPYDPTQDAIFPPELMVSLFTLSLNVREVVGSIQIDLIKVELVELEAEYYHVTLLLIII